MKTEKDFKKWIDKQVKYYQPILGLELHRVDIMRAKNDDYMFIACTHPYLDPTIWYSQKAFNDWKIGKLEKDRICHELCHIITDPLFCKATSRYVSVDEIKDEREKLTDIISAIIRKLLNKKNKPNPRLLKKQL